MGCREIKEGSDTGEADRGPTPGGSCEEGRGGRARLAGGQHDRVPEELEGDGAEEALGRACLHGRGVQVALAEAIVPCMALPAVRSLLGKDVHGPAVASSGLKSQSGEGNDSARDSAQHTQQEHSML